MAIQDLLRIVGRINGDADKTNLIKGGVALGLVLDPQQFGSLYRAGLSAPRKNERGDPDPAFELVAAEGIAGLEFVAPGPKKTPCGMCRTGLESS